MDLAVAALRGLHLAALIAALGACVVAWLSGTPPRGRWLLVCAIVAGVGWLGLQSAQISGLGWPRAQVITLTSTGFGQVLSLRIALLAGALAFPHPALLIVALGLQPLLGHGAATALPVTLSGALHVLAGGLWAGTLPWLWLLLRDAPEAGLRAARRFTPIGLALVLFLAVGAVGQWPLVGGIAGLFGTGYGHAILVKMALLLSMLVCAGLNAVWLAPAGHALALRQSIAIEGAAAAGVIGTAAWLAMQPPGAHDTILWPFPVQPAPNLWNDAFLTDRLFRMATPIMAAGAAILTALAVLRHSRTLSAGLAVVATMAVWQMPVFPAAPFLRPAVPTTFQMPPMRRSTASILRGQEVYDRACAACHGVDTRGRGPEATGDPVWPPDLTAPLFQTARDGDWFWAAHHGKVRDDGEIWQAIDYIRARASARHFDGSGRAQSPPAMPALRLSCASLGIDLSRPPGGVMLFYGKRLPPDGVLHLDPDACTPLSREAVASLALLTGTRLGMRPEFLVDADGFLRQLWVEPADETSLVPAVEWARANPASGILHH